MPISKKQMFSIQDKLTADDRTDEDIAEAISNLRKYVTQTQFAKTRMDEARKEERRTFDATDARKAFERELTKRPVMPKDQFGNFLDPIYIALTALAQEPANENITAAMTHWKSMIRQNRLF